MSQKIKFKFKIREMLQKKNVSGYALFVKRGLKPSNYAKVIMDGYNPKLDTLIGMAIFLKCDINDLIDCPEYEEVVKNIEE